MRNLSNKLTSLFALVMIALGWLGWGVLKKMLPMETFIWYPYIPVFFCLLGIFSIVALANSYKLEKKKLVNVYMALKLLKMLTAMIYLLVFYFVVRKDIRVFGIVFASFYAIYIGLETFVFYSIEKQIKKEK